ncbi:hypothetical protein [Marinobacter sp. AC-23]|uniref:hypothetical protein n=1 Tax=Marinobacter sp. AC-23 TaxID=1879031 RepID=UPI0008DD6A2F|nr:hypothetical protein [Marinobacter sp. AC-23]OHY79452.1 hypothetical protein BCA33_16230 [Marinobacter sp. AC-23]
MRDKRALAGIVVGIVGIVLGAAFSYWSSAHFFDEGKSYVHSELSNRALRRGVDQQQVDASKDADELYGLILEKGVEEAVRRQLDDATANAVRKGEDRGRAACEVNYEKNIGSLRNEMSAQKLEFQNREEKLKLEFENNEGELTRQHKVRQDRLSAEISRLAEQIYLERFWAHFESAVVAANELAGVDDIAKLTDNQRRWMVENAQAMVDVAERGRTAARTILKALNGAIDDLQAVLATDPVDMDALKRAVGRINAGLGSARQIYVEGELLFHQPAE